MDEFIHHKDFKQFFQDNFVIVPLVVMEQPAKKSLENAGGMTVLRDVGGENGGLPFTAILDHNGKLIINSNREGKAGQNIGHPFAPEEVDHFMTMLKKGAPRMSKANEEKIRTFLLSQKKE